MGKLDSLRGWITILKMREEDSTNGLCGVLGVLGVLGMCWRDCELDTEEEEGLSLLMEFFIGWFSFVVAETGMETVGVGINELFLTTVSFWSNSFCERIVVNGTFLATSSPLLPGLMLLPDWVVVSL